MIQIAGLGLTGLLFTVILGKMKPEYGVLAALCTSVIIFFLAMDKFQYVYEALDKFTSFMGVSRDYFVIMLKLIGIAYLAEFASGICKDQGQSAIASQIDVIGKVSMLAISIPILQSLFQTLGEYISG